jgi:hypothetical protein
LALAIGCRVVGGAQGVRTVQVKAGRGGTEEKSELQPVESHKAFIFMTLFLCVAQAIFFRNFFRLLCVVVVPLWNITSAGTRMGYLACNTLSHFFFFKFNFIRPPSFLKKRTNKPSVGTEESYWSIEICRLYSADT